MYITHRSPIFQAFEGCVVLHRHLILRTVTGLVWTLPYQMVNKRALAQDISFEN